MLQRPKPPNKTRAALVLDLKEAVKDMSKGEMFHFLIEHYTALDLAGMLAQAADRTPQPGDRTPSESGTVAPIAPPAAEKSRYCHNCGVLVDP